MAFDPALRHLIARFRASKEWDEDLDLRLLQALWPSLAGPGLAQAAAIAALDGGKVLMRLQDPAWEPELRSMRAGLLRRLNEPWSTRRITDIGFIHEDRTR